MAILAMGSTLDFPVQGKAGDDGVKELASFLMPSLVDEFALSRYAWRAIGKQLRVQFPGIDFGAIKERSLAFSTKVGDDFTGTAFFIEEMGGWCQWVESSTAYKKFAHQCECSFGRTRLVRQLTDAEAQIAEQTVKNGGVEKTFYHDKSIPIPGDYKCAACGEVGVKLWRPYMYNEPLICATCAEERQVEHTYTPVEKWEESTFPNGEPCWSGRPLREPDADGNMVDVKFLMLKWIVSNKGKIPSPCSCPGPDGYWSMTDHLIVDISDISKSYSSGSTDMIPAVPNEDGDMWGYTSVPENGCKWWEELPTHKSKAMETKSYRRGGFVPVESKIDVPINDELIDPHYNDSNFDRGQRTVFLAEGFGSPEDGWMKTVFDQQGCYILGSRLPDLVRERGLDYPKQYTAARLQAKEQGEPNTALYYQKYLSVLLNEPMLKLVHILAGVKPYDGYSYLEYGYVIKRVEVGKAKLEGVSYSYASVMEMKGSRLTDGVCFSFETGEVSLAPNKNAISGYIIPSSVRLNLYGEPVFPTHFNERGFPQFSGLAESVLWWKIRQRVYAGKLDSEYRAEINYKYEKTYTPLTVPIEDRLPKITVCPVCGRGFSVDELSEVERIGEDQIFITHESCAKEYYKLKMSDEICRIVGLVFNTWGISDDEKGKWGDTLTYELIPNEYCGEACCAHRPWFMFHTPLGDIKIGWRKRVINIEFQDNFRKFDLLKLFAKEDVTKDQNSIHAWGYEKFYEYLKKVHQTLTQGKRKKEK